MRAVCQHLGSILFPSFFPCRCSKSTLGIHADLGQLQKGLRPTPSSLRAEASQGAQTPAQAKGGTAFKALGAQEGEVREGFSEAAVHPLEFGRRGLEPRPDELLPSLFNQRGRGK